jgi:hypothetical protein
MIARKIQHGLMQKLRLVPGIERNTQTHQENYVQEMEE